MKKYEEDFQIFERQDHQDTLVQGTSIYHGEWCKMYSNII